MLAAYAEIIAICVSCIVHIIAIVCAYVHNCFSLGQQKICFLKPETGPCKGKFARYYYDPRSNECERFVYGGCDGNENNFETQKECDKMCKSKLASNIKGKQSNNIRQMLHKSM